MNDKSDVFRSILAKYWFSQIRDAHPSSEILKIVRHPQGSLTESEFKWYLADAILNRRFSVEEYERLTDFDFATREEVATDLAQLWRLMFESERIALPREAGRR